MLDTYDEVREALRQRDLKQALYDAGGSVMADSLITLHGEAHKRRRRAENRLFRRGTFRWCQLGFKFYKTTSTISTKNASNY